MCAAFVESLMREGRLQVDMAPHWSADPAALKFLEYWGQQQALHLAGPDVPVDLDLAAGAVGVLYRAAWFFLHPEQMPREEDFEVGVPPSGGRNAPGPAKAGTPTFMAKVPARPADHFSADLALRFLAGLWQRAQNREASSLVKIMEKILRRWPLPGVLTKIWEPPECPLDLGGHPGLSFLYAERLARHFRPGWVPAASVLPFVEIVWEAQGKDWPVQ